MYDFLKNTVKLPENSIIPKELYIDNFNPFVIKLKILLYL